MENYALMGDGRILDGELAEEQRGSDEYLANNPNYQNTILFPKGIHLHFILD